MSRLTCPGVSKTFSVKIYVLANPVVTSSKLTVNEAAQLEAPLSLYELDEAAKH